MNKSYEVEYTNLDLRFDRRTIHNFIKSLIQEGYSLYWSENETSFIASIRSGRRLVKLTFQRSGDRFKLVGNYSFRDEKLAELMEWLIGATRGHAIVKRFRDRLITIENIMFGEIIRMVEISGVERKVVYQKDTLTSLEDVEKAFESKAAEDRVRTLRYELDYELQTLWDALTSGDASQAEQSKAKLEMMRHEMLLLDM